MENMLISLDEYLERFLAFEVDFLTEDVKDVVDVTADDSYMLCYGFCDGKGKFNFIVLAVGPNANECNKGLDISKPLKIYRAEELLQYPFEEVEPRLAAREKCSKYVNLRDPLSANDSLRLTRRMPMFDSYRDLDYPDVIEAEFLDGDKGMPVLVRITSSENYGIISGCIVDSVHGENGREVKLFPSLFDENPCIIAMPSEEVKIIAASFDDLINKFDDSTIESIEDALMAATRKEKYRC